MGKQEHLCPGPPCLSPECLPQLSPGIPRARASSTFLYDVASLASAQLSELMQKETQTTRVSVHQLALCPPCCSNSQPAFSTQPLTAGQCRHLWQVAFFLLQCTQLPFCVPLFLVHAVASNSEPAEPTEAVKGHQGSHCLATHHPENHSFPRTI